ncbi:hypothetical protein SCA03_17650 [Streptomyces cacaoi]|uniref:HTH marR-type domain-containing protein n=1 Tax=Streptomyces cacaoi TaxID=1898 RepID=A0A4Y3QUY2_STRCI|nr:hypothetical protein SCA03_17650 [Streptomyces cacaoi]
MLNEHAAITSAELARRCQVTPQTMTSTVAKLEGRGLLIREPHPVHGTLVELRLTPRGRELFRLADARVTELDDHLAHGLTAAEVESLKGLLTRVADNAAGAGS